jgi:pimeloyl-ACP methyl ester carboxylesterase
MLLAARRQQQQIELFARLEGTVRAEAPSEHRLIVVLVNLGEGEPKISDHFVTAESGRWAFSVSPGQYAITAFVDRSANLIYEPDEPALAGGDAILHALGPGERITEIEVVIPEAGRASGRFHIEELQARHASEQTRVSIGRLSVRGDVVSLDDPRFDAENASLGLWKPLDFVLDVGAGVYFLEPYDADRIPVLFVHGIDGSPRNFEELVDNLDRERFQPWFYFYPSGLHLQGLGDHLAGILSSLRHRHHFEQVYVVAHSMGGLVSRSFILRQREVSGEEFVTLFVSIATSWAGVDSAQSGVERSPVVVYSWHDLAPNSDFLAEIFYADGKQKAVRRRLPSAVEYHLFFGFRRKSGSFGASSDAVINLDSALRPEAQEEAHRVRGFNDDHTGILRADDVSTLLNRILQERR